jgi:multiple antibiotic resistance protein
MMMLDSFGTWPTFVSLIINMLIVWGTLAKADLIMRFLGPGGARAFSKIMYILLAAISIMMIRKGVFNVVGM